MHAKTKAILNLLAVAVLGTSVRRGTSAELIANARVREASLGGQKKAENGKAQECPPLLALSFQP